MEKTETKGRTTNKIVNYNNSSSTSINSHIGGENNEFDGGDMVERHQNHNNNNRGDLWCETNGLEKRE